MKAQNRQQFLIILTAIMAALLIGNSLVFNPLSNLWSKRSDEIKKLKTQVDDGSQMIKNEARYHARWDNMRTNALPVNTSLAAQQVINALDNWATSSGVADDLNIMPQWKYDSTNYMTFNCHVAAHGTMSAVSQFIYQIEKGPMALKLDSMDLSAHDEFGQNLQLDLQISGLALLMPAMPTTK